jgi:O-antigen ligase
MTFRRPSARLAITALLAAACVPAFATLNRGMFLALGLVLAYASIRLALRGRLLPLSLVLGGASLGLAVALSVGVLARLQERLHYSRTNLGRQTIYREAFDGALDSPIFGHGAPKPSLTLDVSIGTQGQVWNVMFSYGFVALAFFLGWFALVVLQSWRARRQADLWVHATLFVAFATFFYYGYDGIQLTVVMTAAALALRTRRGEAAPAVPQSLPSRQLAAART